MAKKSFVQKIKDFFTGGNSSSGKSSSGKSSSNVKKASKSYYGGGYSSTYRTSAKRREDDEKEKQRQKLAEQNKQTTAKLAEIAKVSQRTDALSSGKKALPPEPKALANNGVERAIEKIGKKSQGQKNLEILEARRREARDARREAQGAYHEATHHRYDVAEEGISKEERERRKQNIRTAPMGEMMFGREDEAVDVAKAKMKYDRVGTSVQRGMANVGSLGVVNLAEKRLAKGTRKEAEDIYQANKSRFGEGVGSLIGGLGVYGGTALGFEGVGTDLVGKAAATELGKKLGAEKLAQVMAGEGAKAALARSLVGDAIQDSTMGAFHSGMNIAARDDLETFGDYAKAFVGEQALNYGMGLAGNALGHGLPIAGRTVRDAWSNFADESRKLRIVPKGVAESYDNLLSERKELMDNIFAKNENADPNALRRLQEINSELENIEQAHPEIKGKTTKKNVKKATKAAESESKITEDNVKNPTETAEPEAKITDEPVNNPSNPTEEEIVRNRLRNDPRMADFNRYDDLVAERNRLIDGIPSTEDAPQGLLRRLDEIDEEMSRIVEAHGGYLEHHRRLAADEIRGEIVNEYISEASARGARAEAPNRKPTKTEQLRDELVAERETLQQAYETAKANGEDVTQILDDLQEHDLLIKDAERKIARADKARKTRAAKATQTEAPTPRAEAEVRAEEPVTDIAPSGERVETGENANAGAGERTEFRRSEEQTEREQARNRRTEGNRQRATQESFDADYDDFVRKANESQEKISDLKRQLRAATSEEEKAALKQQIDALNREVKSAYNRASLRYHPDRGGSNEWMGKFNEAYDSFKRGSYSSRGFSGASSSTRARTDAGSRAYERYRRAASNGDGGSTPPPRNGAKASGNDGFKKPKGKAKKGHARTVDSVEDIVFKRKEKTTLGQKLKEVKDDARMKIADSHAPFEDVARKFVRSNPEKFQNMYGSINAHRSSGSIATQTIHNKQLNYMGQAYEDGKSLFDIYKGMDEKTENAFDAYLLLKHSPDRLNAGTPIFDNVFAKNVSGKLDDPEIVQREIDRLLREHPEFETRAQDVYKYTQNELKNLVDAGIVSKETAAEWAEKYPFYVPTHRAGYNGMATNVRGSIIGASGKKATKGSDYDIRSIRDQLEEMTRQNWEDITLNDMLKDVFSDRIPTTALSEPAESLERALGNSISIAKSADGKKFYAEVYIKGQKKRFEIEKQYVDGLEDWNKNGRFGHKFIDTTNEAVGKYTRIWRNLITEWSPWFLIKNPTKDIPEAFINSRQGKEFAKKFGPAIYDLATQGPYSTALRNAGISQSSFFDLDKALVEDLKGGRKGLLKPLGALGDKLAGANQFMEMLPRLSEYMATFEKAGKTLEQAIADGDKALLNRAAANAADVTVNFGRSGSVGKGVNRGYIPFFNASVQGWSKFARNFQEQPGAKAYLSFGAKLLGLGMGFTAANNFFLKENQNYQAISGRDKANNLIIPYPLKDWKTTDTFVRIPKSRFAAVTGLLAVNAFNENKMPFADMIKVANDQVAPVNPLESHFLAPFFAVNKTDQGETWYGTPIVPESLMGLEKYAQADANTSNISKAVGKASGKVSDELVKMGVNPKTAEKVQISPKKLDYIIDAEGGAAADLILPLTTPSKQGGGKGLQKYGTTLGKTITAPFTIDSSVQNNLSTRFYDEFGRVEKANNTRGGKQNKEEFDRLNSYSTEISGINKAIRHLQGSDSENKQENIKGLQQIKTSLMQDALDGKEAPTSAKKLDAVQKYVGTSFAIENFGSSADKQAMKVYGKAKYGKLSDEEMEKKINADEGFYKGVRAIGELEDKITSEAGVKSNTKLMKAVALASAGADNDLFGAYECANKGRTESDNKMNRARAYLKSGGSEEEFAQLEKVRKNYGKLTEYDKDAEIDKIDDQLAKGEISIEEYNNRADAINYNANISYIGLATSLAQANAPERGYRLYDIKDKNIQKGINLAAMGFTARDYRDMTKALDTNGNGYPSKAEITAYVANSDIEDKATLFDALYSYQGRNPFGTPTNYTRSQAAEMGRSNGIESISNESGAFSLNPKESSSGSGWRRYGGGYHYHGHGGGSSKKAKVPAPKKIAKGSLKSGEALVSKKKSSSSMNNSKTTLARVEAKIDLPTAKYSKQKRG